MNIDRMRKAGDDIAGGVVDITFNTLEDVGKEIVIPIASVEQGCMSNHGRVELKCVSLGPVVEVGT